jgi:hypothetical protein
MKGKDKCRKHGGKTPIKHGLYSKYLPTRACEIMAEMRAESDALLAVSEVVLTLHALLAERMESGIPVTELLPLITELAKNIERHHKITYGEKHTITTQGLEQVLKQIVDAIDSTVTDKSDRARLIGRLAKLRIR